MIRRPPRSTRMTHSFPTRSSSDLQFGAVHPDGTAVVDPRRDLKSPQQGAATTIWCATSPALASFGGVYCEDCDIAFIERSEEHTSELQSLMRISYAVFCLKKKNRHINI